MNRHQTLFSGTGTTTCMTVTIPNNHKMLTELEPVSVGYLKKKLQLWPMFQPQKNKRDETYTHEIEK